MKAINYSTMRERFKDYCDLVSDESETIIVTRKGQKNVVIMSEDAYNSLMEQIAFVNNRINYERLKRAKKQIERNLGKEYKTIKETYRSVWTHEAIEDYQYVKRERPQYAKRIDQLCEEIVAYKGETPIRGEPLFGEFSGYYTRRVSDHNRLVYTMKEEVLYILACRTH